MGGAEKLISETLPRYVEQGFDVELLLTTDINTPLREELQKKIKIQALPYKSFYNIRAVFKIIPFLRNYDLIHVHLFPPLYFVAIAKILSRSKVPLIFTEHSTTNSRMKFSMLAILEKIIYNQYEKIVCITERISFILECYLGKLIRNKLIVIENGVNLERIRLAHPIEKNHLNNKISSNDILLLQVSSFQEPKDQPTVIRALRHLPPHIKLLLAGEGVLKKESEKLVTELGLDDRVIFLGVRNDIPNLIKSVDIIILSSKYEGLSLSSVEGLSSGKPFIASNVPGLSEIVEDSGILFNLGDDNNLAMKITKLLSSKAYYKEIADKCKKKSSLYDINIMIKKHVDMYRKILER